CYGVVYMSVYLGAALSTAGRADGYLEVGPTLQVTGQTTVFALGDLSTADAKIDGFARRQVPTGAANTTALMPVRSERADYKSMGAAIVVPIGHAGGAGQFPGQSEIVA